MADAADMVHAMRRLAEIYGERGLQAPSPWMGRPEYCPLCRAEQYPHLHRWEWVAQRGR